MARRKTRKEFDARMKDAYGLTDKGRIDIEWQAYCEQMDYFDEAEKKQPPVSGGEAKQRKPMGMDKAIRDMTADELAKLPPGKIRELRGFLDKCAANQEGIKSDVGRELIPRMRVIKKSRVRKRADARALEKRMRKLITKK